MKLNRALLPAAGLAVVLIGAGWLLRTPTKQKSPRNGATEGAAKALRKRTVSRTPLGPSSTAPAKVAEAASASPVTSEGRSPTRRGDRVARDLARKRIYRALGRPFPDSGASPQTHARASGPTLDKDYIQERIHEDFYPLAGTCYEAALELDPKLAGRLVLSFVIVGDESVGGIVESVEIDPSTTIAGDELLYCMRESLLSLVFEPPKGGGSVTVTYPFELSPDDPE